MASDRFDPTPGIGELAQRARQRRLRWIILALVTAGFFTGFLAARVEDEGGGFLDGIPPEFAIGFAVVWTLAICYGGWRYHKATDEVERANNRFAAVYAFNAYLTGYPVWFVLWKGGLVPEPDHRAIFVGLYVLMIVLYLWKKFRP
ncbi:hypothetical protein ACNI3Q_03840 [Sphingomonas sp. FW199]|uniref:hypothetical protein n=1 Tax=Sphingomonas sp. FW199 TaxID=3400217 RepID=UPI003CEAD629